jgi:hypothetical protein
LLLKDLLKYSPELLCELHGAMGYEKYISASSTVYLLIDFMNRFNQAMQRKIKPLPSTWKWFYFSYPLLEETFFPVLLYKALLSFSENGLR